jgi:hypothetical protein
MTRKIQFKNYGLSEKSSRFFVGINSVAVYKTAIRIRKMLKGGKPYADL